MRSLRKKEHLENYLKSSYKSDSLFDDVFLYHQAVSELDYDEIDTSVEFLGREISFPFMINAITGGNEYVNGINEDLANIAKNLNIPMAVGSQKIALDDEEAVESFSNVREINPEGIVISNLGALASLEDAKKAVDMIDADALQIHLNIGQELVMTEGDRSFKQILKNIESIVNGLGKPVIVKEIGMGISKESCEKLYSVGVRYIDIAGKGGSNFVEIENLRNPLANFTELYSWGIPTALSLYDLTRMNKEDLKIISSGGIRTATDIVKSLALGAEMTAASGEVLNYLVHGNYEIALNFVNGLKNKLKIIMMLSDCKNIEELKHIDYKITGKLKELISD